MEERRGYNLASTTILGKANISTAYRCYDTYEGESWGFETIIWSLDQENKRDNILFMTSSGGAKSALKTHHDLSLRVLEDRTYEDEELEASE
jgi:hypothetical protein